MNNCKVGSSVVVEGYLSLGKLELPDGSLRNMHEVVTENVLLLQVSGDERIGVFNNHADFEDDDFSTLTNRINPKASIHEGAIMNE